MRLLVIATFVWLVAIVGVAFLMRDSTYQTRGISGTAGAAAGSLFVLYRIQKKRGFL